jgi:hypothetical protein
MKNTMALSSSSSAAEITNEMNDGTRHHGIVNVDVGEPRLLQQDYVNSDIMEQAPHNEHKHEHEHEHGTTTAIHAVVQDTVGILEDNVFPFLETSDLVTASAVCRRWHQAARGTNHLWRAACQRLWKHKHVMGYSCGLVDSGLQLKEQQVWEEGNHDNNTIGGHSIKSSFSCEIKDKKDEPQIPLYGRILLSEDAIQRLTLEEMKGVLRYRILQADASHAGYDYHRMAEGQDRLDPADLLSRGGVQAHAHAQGSHSGPGRSRVKQAIEQAMESQDRTRMAKVITSYMPRGYETLSFSSPRPNHHSSSSSQEDHQGEEGADRESSDDEDEDDDANFLSSGDFDVDDGESAAVAASLQELTSPLSAHRGGGPPPRRTWVSPNTSCMKDSIWFASYLSSILDSKRTDLLSEELCLPMKFEFYFKLYYLEETEWELTGTTGGTTTTGDHIVEVDDSGEDESDDDVPGMLHAFLAQQEQEEQQQEREDVMEEGGDQEDDDDVNVNGVQEAGNNNADESIAARVRERRAQGGRQQQQPPQQQQQQHTRRRRNPPVVGQEWYATCVFSVDGIFRFEEEEQPENGNNNNEQEQEQTFGPHPWRWVIPGRAVQVGQYPPLVVSRFSSKKKRHTGDSGTGTNTQSISNADIMLGNGDGAAQAQNWGWKLENSHVCLVSK